MKIHCLKCGKELHPDYKFCPFCGNEAPRSTIVGKITEEKIKNGIFCPYCKHKNVEHAHFCSDCGQFLYTKPKSQKIYCPHCGKKIPQSTIYCFNCKQNIQDWFAQKGTVAEKLGWKGNIILYEKMNQFYYHFILDETLELGNLDNNDIRLPCEWVSGNHCIFDNIKSQLIDLDSTNGTFINRSDNRVKKVNFGSINEFNIAGSFTFTVHKSDNIFAFRLTAILDEKECKLISDFRELNKQRKHYYILISDNDTVHIRKFDGKIVSEIDELEDIYSFTVRNNYIYYSDHSKDIKEQLIMAENNCLPANWVIKNLNI